MRKIKGSISIAFYMIESDRSLSLPIIKYNSINLTNSIDEEARKYEIEYVEHRASSQLDHIGDVWIRLDAARVILVVFDSFEAH